MKHLEKFYVWCHHEHNTFAVIWVCFPLVVMALEKVLGVESLFLPAIGFIFALSCFFKWGDRFWWNKVEYLF